MAKPKDVIRQIKKATRRQFSAEEKIRIVLEGLRGESRSATSSGSEGLEHRLAEMTDLGIDASTHSPTALENWCLPTYNHCQPARSYCANKPATRRILCGRAGTRGEQRYAMDFTLS